MGNFKIEKIKNIEQYNLYCKRHEELIVSGSDSAISEIELLEVLIEKYDDELEGEKMKELNPVELLREIINDDGLSATALSKELAISKQIISNILNYKRPISKNIALKLSNHFAMSLEAFGREYDLDNKQIKSPRKTTIASTDTALFRHIKNEFEKYLDHIDSCEHHQDKQSKTCIHFISPHRKKLEELLSVTTQ